MLLSVRRTPVLINRCSVAEQAKSLNRRVAAWLRRGNLFMRHKQPAPTGALSRVCLAGYGRGILSVGSVRVSSLLGGLLWTLRLGQLSRSAVLIRRTFNENSNATGAATCGHKVVERVDEVDQLSNGFINRALGRCVLVRLRRSAERFQYLGFLVVEDMTMWSVIIAMHWAERQLCRLTQSSQRGIPSSSSIESEADIDFGSESRRLQTRRV